MANDTAGARLALQAWFEPVAELNKVYRSFPRRIPDLTGYGLKNGVRSGAVGIVHIGPDHESRTAVGGLTSGRKRIDYDVEIQVLMKSSRLQSEDAQDDFDKVIDAVKARLRAGRTLGSADVWQAGEKYIDTERVEPKITARWTELWGAVKFDLTQFIAS